MKKKNSLHFLQPYFLLLIPLTTILKEHPEIHITDFIFVTFLLGIFIFLIHSFLTKLIHDGEKASMALSALALSFFLSEFTGLSKPLVWCFGSITCLLLLFIPINLKLKTVVTRKLLFPLTIILLYNSISTFMIKQHPSKSFFEMVHLKTSKYKNRATFANEEFFSAVEKK